MGMLIEARKSDIGGYAAASEPVTLKPRCFSSPASDAMAVPQIPMICTCCCSTILDYCSNQHSAISIQGWLTADLLNADCYCVAASKVLNLTSVPSAFNSACTPIGNVTFPLVTCPDLRP